MDEQIKPRPSPQLQRLLEAIRQLTLIWASLLYASAPFALAWLVSLATTFGRHIHPELYTVIAGILPIVLIACLVENRLAFDRMPSDKIRSNRVISAYLAQLLIFIGGETCALYAIATQAATTFLTVAACGAALFLTIGIVESALTYFAIVRLPDPDAATQKLFERAVERTLAKQGAKAIKPGSAEPPPTEKHRSQ